MRTLVLDSGQQALTARVSVIYQAFCEMWLSLLCPRQEAESTEVCKQNICTFERMQGDSFMQKVR